MSQLDLYGTLFIAFLVSVLLVAVWCLMFLPRKPPGARWVETSFEKDGKRYSKVVRTK